MSLWLLVLLGPLGIAAMTLTDPPEQLDIASTVVWSAIAAMAVAVVIAGVIAIGSL